MASRSSIFRVQQKQNIKQGQETTQPKRVGDKPFTNMKNNKEKGEERE